MSYASSMLDLQLPQRKVQCLRGVRTNGLPRKRTWCSTEWNCVAHLETLRLESLTTSVHRLTSWFMVLTLMFSRDASSTCGARKRRHASVGLTWLISRGMSIVSLKTTPQRQPLLALDSLVAVLKARPKSVLLVRLSVRSQPETWLVVLMAMKVTLKCQKSIGIITSLEHTERATKAEIFLGLLCVVKASRRSTAQTTPCVFLMPREPTIGLKRCSKPPLRRLQERVKTRQPTCVLFHRNCKAVEQLRYLAH